MIPAASVRLSQVSEVNAVGAGAVKWMSPLKKQGVESEPSLEAAAAAADSISGNSSFHQ